MGKFCKEKREEWFRDLPDNQTLASTTIPRGKDTRQAGHVLTRGRLDVFAWIQLNLTAQHFVLGSQEPHGQQHQLSREELLRPFHRLHVPPARDRLGPFDAVDVDARDVSAVVSDEFLRHDAVLAWVFAHVGLHFGVAVVDAVDAWPLRPGVIPRARSGGRLREQFEVGDGLGAVADGGADAVVARVAAADDDDVLTFGGDVGSLSASSESRRDLVLRCRNCMAKWMPSSSRLGILRSRATVAPVAMTTASVGARRDSRVILHFRCLGRLTWR